MHRPLTGNLTVGSSIESMRIGPLRERFPIGRWASRKTLAPRALRSISTVVIVSIATGLCTAQETNQPAGVEVNGANDLALQQSQIAEKFTRLEKLLLRMGEYDAANNPRRSAVLKKAVRLSSDRHIRVQFEALVNLLSEDRLGPAIKNQSMLRSDLQQLLELLMTENRSDRLKDEQKKYRDRIKAIERLLRMQISVQGRTEGGGESAALADEQDEIAEQTDKLEQDMAGDDPTGPRSNSNQSSDGEESENGEADGQPGERNEESGEREVQDHESVDSDSSESDQAEKPEKQPPNSDEVGDNSDGAAEEPGEPSAEGDSSEGQSTGGAQGEDGSGRSGDSSGESSSGQSGPPGESGQSGESSEADNDESKKQNQAPGQRRIQEAHRRMLQAQERLAQAEREQAVEAQEAARHELEAAKAELEEILRQMREEEIERVLAMLEARFQKMLDLQLRVYEETKRLEKSTAENPGRRVEIEAGKLSFDERRIGMEADRCLALLREEASSVAFPESVRMMRDDIGIVVDRLARTQLGAITQGVEEDIIESLREMIEALQKAQKEQEEQRQSPRSPQMAGEDPNSRPLVDQIAELKMIKALQLRINRRTDRYGRLLEDIEDPIGQARDEDLIDGLHRLSDREKRLQQITRDVVAGKNK